MTQAPKSQVGQSKVDTAALDSQRAPTPIAPELLKLIGGGQSSPTTQTTPQAPKNTW